MLNLNELKILLQSHNQCLVPGPFLGVVGGAGVVVDDPDDDVLELEIDL